MAQVETIMWVLDDEGFWSDAISKLLMEASVTKLSGFVVSVVQNKNDDARQTVAGVSVKLIKDHMKNILSVIVKVVISIGLISWVLDGADLEHIWHTIKSANIPLLSAAFLNSFMGCFITTKRWQTLLAALEVPVSIKGLVQSFSISVFFNNFLPSTIGGDA